MMEDIKEEAIKNSTYVWIQEKQIKNENGKVIKIGPDSPHYFLKDLYTDEADEIAVVKPSQAGVSTWAILTELHDARYWGINQIHTLPANKDVQQFVPSKINEIIKHNPDIRTGMDKKNVDAVSQKQFGKAFLYIKGTKGDSDTLMLSSDRNWYDELDASDQSKIGAYESRMEGESSLRQKRYISTPTLPGYGISLKFEESDQKHWRLNCGHCNHEQHMTFPDNIDMKKEEYICSKCGKPLKKEDIRGGKWKAKYPDRKVSGYQITQMICPWIKPSDIVQTYRDAELGKNEMTMEYFYNHKLGLPYVEASSQIPKSLILQNCRQRDHLETDSIMGMDVQLNELYAILGSKEGIYGILRLRDSEEFIQSGGTTGKSKWDRWAEVMEAYNVRYCIIDGGFTPNEVIENAEKFPGRVWVNWYKDDPSKDKIIRWAEGDFTKKGSRAIDEYKVLTERDRALDLLLAQLKHGAHTFFYSPEDQGIKMLIKHIETTYARMVTDRKGNISREWVSTGKDDLLHAMVYFMIGRERMLLTES